jgi:hypothetical protein
MLKNIYCVYEEPLLISLIIYEEKTNCCIGGCND